MELTKHQKHTLLINQLEDLLNELKMSVEDGDITQRQIVKRLKLSEKIIFNMKSTN